MIQLRVRSEYSFRRAVGSVEALVAGAVARGETAMALTDSGTWGHVQWRLACEQAGITPLYGAEVLVVANARERTRQPGSSMVLLAGPLGGVEQLYRLMTLAHQEDRFYYVPRLDYDDLTDFLPGRDLYLLSGNAPDLTRLPQLPGVYLELMPNAPGWCREARKHTTRWPLVVTSDNLYPTRDDQLLYQSVIPRPMLRAGPQHVCAVPELERAIVGGLPPEALALTETLARQLAGAQLPTASMVKVDRSIPLRTLCEQGVARRGLAWTPEYEQRLQHELDMIASKQFEDYFRVIATMTAHAKERMLVGPARGSAAGSLVCYLLGITEVDPLVYGLMFERFIDVTRADLPDIDLDFPDAKRDSVIAGLVERYGAERVGRLGTVNRYGPDSAINDVAKLLHIPSKDVADLKGAILRRSSGDARAAMGVTDAFTTLDIGKRLLAAYPRFALAGQLEGAARHSGKHAAGVVVTDAPLACYGTVDTSGTIQVDKYDAERLKILKIDVLGLRTLTVLEDCLDQLGQPYAWLTTLPTEDAAAFQVLNEERWAGIFQFEGFALQSLCRQMRVKEFNDIVAITALARPGPLHAGASAQFIARRLGQEEVTSLHPMVAHLTHDSLGLVVYQEQVMAIGRAMGNLTWEDVSKLRKAMSSSLGEEFFNRFWEKFLLGATAHQVPEGEARRVWDQMCTFGSWAFNKSHAVSYALISYWCAYLKAHHPLEFAAATLRHPRDDEQSKLLLRELHREGRWRITPVDAARSTLDWSVSADRTELLGGLQNIKGVGPAKAQDILTRRQQGKPLTPGMARLLQRAETPFDKAVLFEGEMRYGDWYRNPRDHEILSGPVHEITDIQEDGTYVFLARLMKKNLRDLNEYGNLVKRGGRRVETNNLFLELALEDDTGMIYATVDRWKYPVLGAPLVETAKVGEWFAWRGSVRNNWRKIYVEKWRKLP